MTPANHPSVNAVSGQHGKLTDESHLVGAGAAMIMSLSKSTSTPSTPPTVDVVEGVELGFRKPKYCWQMEAGLDRNFRQLGKLLAKLGLELFRNHNGGL